MYLIEQIIDLLIGPEHPLIWGVISILLGYLIYQHYQFGKAMDEKWQQIMNMIKENRQHQIDSREQLQLVRELLREDLLPIVRHIEKDSEKLQDLEKMLDEMKSDERGWFSAIRDDFNQFRSEFRDILKIFLNGRKRD